METYHGLMGENTDKASDEYLTVNSFGYTKNIDSRLTTLRENGRRDYQILYVHKGYGDFFIHGNMTVVNSGNVVIIAPGEKQFYVFDKSSDATYYWIHFTGREAESLLSRLRLGSGIFATGELAAFIECMDKMAQANAVRDFTTETFLTASLLNLLSTVSKRIYIKESPVHRVIEQMQKDSFNHMTVSEYARMCGLTEYYFIRKFKEITGLTPHRYKTKITVNKAMDMMTSSNLNISEIAYMLGFEDSLYFSRVFRKETGMSPSKFIAITNNNV